MAITVNDVITEMRTRGIATTDLDDTAVTAIVASALGEFRRYKPLTKTTTFETVDGQQSYTWTEIGDTDGMMVTLGVWNPNGSVDELDVTRLIAPYGIIRSPGDYHQPTLEVVEEIKAAEWVKAWGGNVYQIDNDGGDVYLTPTPASDGDTVFLIYTANYGEIGDVRDVDADLLYDLAEHKCSRRMVVELANKSAAVRIKTPEYEIQTGEKIGFWRKNSTECLDRLIDKCKAGHAAAGRT